MFKRVRWMSIGAVAGFAGSLWMQQRVKRTLEEHPSIRVGAELASMARKAGRDVKDAVLDGREAMVQREEELRAELAARLVPIRPDTPLLQAALPNPRHPSRHPGRPSPQLRLVSEGEVDPTGETDAGDPDARDPGSIPAASRVSGLLPPGGSTAEPMSPASPAAERPGRPERSDQGEPADRRDEGQGRPPATDSSDRGRNGRPRRRRR